ncbi:MAG TPA: tryptophan--tRNA ligase [Candidatus Paceibacterota bacterium]|nr:tryptophan--tRNA ligase [Candidatus Paceibacterota bacterium]
MAETKRLFTGLQPSGQLHIGNYFGALKPTVELFKNHEGLIMVADYHSLTSLKDGPALRENIVEIVRAYLAAGIDPERATIFKQSDVPEHTELAWIFNCLVTVAFLELGHAYKDKVAKGLEANAGLLTYPMLMAADILLYDTDVVPVGEDQRQHVEYAREAAAKFNNAFGQTFKEPQEMIQKAVGIIPGTDGKKMSKSYGNTIPLFGTKDEIAKAVMSIVTDSDGGLPKNVYEIHKLFRPDSLTQLEAVYEKYQGNYKALKEMLVDDIESIIAPMREKRDSITDEQVREVLNKGAEKAKAIASAKMEDVRKKVGVSI